jgi:hypothetical protein
MGLRDILERHKIPLPADFEDRLDIIVSGLKKKPDFSSKLAAYKKTRGGADEDPVAPIVKSDTEDYLGPRIRWFMEAATSPYARTMLEGIFMVVFYLAYLEKVPVFGSLLSASLDVILAGGKMWTKTIQSSLPPMIGLLPLPYASMVGIGMAAVFGFIVWPIFAIISLSRKDFAAATESYIRVIPPPFGDMIANTFLEGNRAVAKLDEKRIKLSNDISTALTKLSELATTVSASVKEGFKSLADQTTAAAEAASNSIRPAPPVVPEVTGGFHRRTRRRAWRTPRTRRRFARR